jgi:hypothetical protein
MESFVQRLAFGRTAEETIARILQHRYGCHVVPVYDYSAGDKAPRLQGAHGGYVVPDLDVSKNGDRSWVEVKAKNNAGSRTWLTGRVEHGFSWRLFQQYQMVQQITGTRVYIIILETHTNDILYQSLDQLDAVKRVYEGDKMDRGGTVFFPRDSFEFLCNAAEAP